MRILIEDKYLMTSDSLNIILKKKRVVQEGKTKGQIEWDLIGYFGCVEHALNKLLDIKVRQSTATSLKELVSTIETFRKENCAVFEGV